MNCFAGEGHVVHEDCFPQYLDAIRPVIKKALTLAALTSGFQTLLTATCNRSSMVKTQSVTSATAEDTPADDGVTIPTTKEETPPLWTQPTGYSGRMASAVTGRIHTINPRPAQYNDRPVPTQGLRGATKTETPCLPSSAQITLITRVRTYL